VPNLARSGRTSAFGHLNVPKREVIARLEILHRKISKLGPERGPIATASGYLPKREKFRDKLRHGIADALQLSVVFRPWRGNFTIKGEKKYGKHPVWEHAPPKARVKSQKFCELLNQLVDFGGFRSSRLYSVLYRLSLRFWSMSMKDFDGVIRLIRVILYDSVPRRGAEWFRKAQNLGWASTLSCKPWDLFPCDNRFGNRSKPRKGPELPARA